MEASELNKVEKKLKELELELREEYGLTQISGGFVKISVESFDHWYIYIKVKSGVQSDVTNDVVEEKIKMNRLRLILERSKRSIEICFSMSDIEDMLSKAHKGEEEHFATWSYPTEDGEQIDVRIILGDRGEDYVTY